MVAVKVVCLSILYLNAGRNASGIAPELVEVKGLDILVFRSIRPYKLLDSTCRSFSNIYEIGNLDSARCQCSHSIEKCCVFVVLLAS